MVAAIYSHMEKWYLHSSVLIVCSSTNNENRSIPATAAAVYRAPANGSTRPPIVSVYPVMDDNKRDEPPGYYASLHFDQPPRTKRNDALPPLPDQDTAQYLDLRASNDLNLTWMTHAGPCAFDAHFNVSVNIATGNINANVKVCHWHACTRILN